jgi:hypothetical protein
MQVAASFLEYLVTGALSLLWLLPLLLSLRGGSLDTLHLPDAVILLPLLYALGMLMDGVGYAFTRPIRRAVNRINAVVEKRQVGRRSPPRTREKLQGGLRGKATTVYVLYHSPELARGLELRSTRDRIARGVVANLLLAVIVVFARSWSPWLAVSYSSIGWFLVACLLIALIVWIRFKDLSGRFKYEAARRIQLETKGQPPVRPQETGGIVNA